MMGSFALLPRRGESHFAPSRPLYLTGDAQRRLLSAANWDQSPEPGPLQM